MKDQFNSISGNWEFAWKRDFLYLVKIECNAEVHFAETKMLNFRSKLKYFKSKNENISIFPSKTEPK